MSASEPRERIERCIAWVALYTYITIFPAYLRNLINTLDTPVSGQDESLREKCRSTVVGGREARKFMDRGANFDESEEADVRCGTKLIAQMLGGCLQGSTFRVCIGSGDCRLIEWVWGKYVFKVNCCILGFWFEHCCCFGSELDDIFWGSWCSSSSICTHRHSRGGGRSLITCGEEEYYRSWQFISSFMVGS